MAECEICGNESILIAEALGVCGDCLREGSPRAREFAAAAHANARAEFGLPPARPDSLDGASCRLCVNECRPAAGEPGLCGLRRNVSGAMKSVAGTPRGAAVEWYYDLLPTNCCADWVCPGGSECGYPRYSTAPGIEHGYRNLAVFYYGCTFDCLFCQNWQCRTAAGGTTIKSAQELADAADAETACICSFGGDPTPQLAHAIRASRLARERAKKDSRILRICWETNGAMHPRLAEAIADLSIESGGCIKFDLKAWNAPVHEGLCGTPNTRTFDNFRYLAGRIAERPEVPLLVAATLLVPGYVDVEEIAPISAFIASLDREIPYVLLGFHRDFKLNRLPNTSAAHAERCREAAADSGLKNVRIGNPHLLSYDY